MVRSDINALNTVTDSLIDYLEEKSYRSNDIELELLIQRVQAEQSQFREDVDKDEY